MLSLVDDEVASDQPLFLAANYYNNYIAENVDINRFWQTKS